MEQVDLGNRLVFQNIYFELAALLGRHASSSPFLPAIQNPQPPCPGFVRIPDGDHYRSQYRNRPGNSKTHRFPRGYKSHTRCPHSVQSLSAKASIEVSTGRIGIVEVWEIDLESFASMKAFASHAESLDRLDTAIVNAGLASLQWNLSPEGWERQLQVNVLFTALLSVLLFPPPARSAKRFIQALPHLVLVGSDVHLDAKFDERNAENILEELNEEGAWAKSTAAAGPAERYSLS